MFKYSSNHALQQQRFEINNQSTQLFYERPEWSLSQFMGYLTAKHICTKINLTIQQHVNHWKD